MNKPEYNNDNHNKDCRVKSETRTPLSDSDVTPVLATNPRVKIPVVLAERTLQIVVEADIPLCPPAVEIKRVLKDVFLTQCKLVPVDYTPIDETGYLEVTRAKLFVEGYIRKNIEYAGYDCNGVIYDKIAKVHFSGFAELAGNDFLSRPIIAFSSESKARFINPKNTDIPRLDKYFFENNVFYNEQPYCELISAEFYELDYAPCHSDHDSHGEGSCERTHSEKAFDKLREKIVLDLTLKVLQTQQVQLGAPTRGFNC